MGQRPSSDPRAHAWWQHVPKRRRGDVFRSRRRRLLIGWITSTAGKATMLMIVLLTIIAAMNLSGGGGLALLTLLPLVLIPPLGYLVYWLTWQDFHR
ncbi:hypothetical protein [Cyanobium sp. NIES-981]|uniref:hypothetical protein n=1 Tax=Cyanobium sp. NIES-981 TaxID=1851505 RepID=UPI0007DE00E6|nr:hypothetical protein [Cyanobium sp. NIES-981]SBO44342.1 conserved protein of unknown function [Cyanobium sp. NIES-981]